MFLEVRVPASDRDLGKVSRVEDRSFATVRLVGAIRSSAMGGAGNKRMTKIAIGSDSPRPL
jgi:hypothetical protein